MHRLTFAAESFQRWRTVYHDGGFWQSPEIGAIFVSLFLLHCRLPSKSSDPAGFSEIENKSWLVQFALSSYLFHGQLRRSNVS